MPRFIKNKERENIYRIGEGNIFNRITLIMGNQERICLDLLSQVFVVTYVTGQQIWQTSVEHNQFDHFLLTGCRMDFLKILAEMQESFSLHIIVRSIKIKL